jgi:hypothetical protein
MNAALIAYVHALFAAQHVFIITHMHFRWF